MLAATVGYSLLPVGTGTRLVDDQPIADVARSATVRSDGFPQGH